MPIVNKFKTKETVESIVEKIQQDARFRLDSHLKLAGYLNGYPKEIILAAFKEEQKLQVFANDNDGIKFIKEYSFTAYSGELGPKLKDGDKQIPEGIYFVEYLNPNSSYYLSIKVNYPNEFDKQKSLLPNTKDMGGDIFIHGKASSIGCIAIGDEAIEEVFLLTHKAIDSKVKIIISPRDFRVNGEYPQINSINWKNELYDKIKHELNQLPRRNNAVA